MAMAAAITRKEIKSILPFTLWVELGSGRSGRAINSRPQYQQKLVVSGMDWPQYLQGIILGLSGSSSIFAFI
jgi:hypothetical protein